MRLLFIVALSLLTVTFTMAQGPGAPPAPGIPIDGGITAFLAAAGLIGAGIISFYKKKKTE